MCGVIGLVYERFRSDLGVIASELLKTLEYRGYDSTGAVVQGQDAEHIRIVKGVGAPSLMVGQLGIVDMAGRIFCGQVRWATFGAVDEGNSQPHLVRCKTTIYGAHNGNVTNCDDLKDWLRSEGHRVVSDNDGEMVVHTVEHFFALELGARGPHAAADNGMRRACMRTAILRAAAKLQGSYAAVVVDPVSGFVYAIKAGSSLYFGFGHDETGGQFRIASSDLSSILKLTRVLVPLHEGEFVEYGPSEHRVFALDGKEAQDAAELEREPVRSRLRAKDTALLPPFGTFMEQEIAAQEETSRAVITLFQGGSEALQVLGPHLDGLEPKARDEIRTRLEGLLDLYDDDAIRKHFHALVDCEPMRRVLAGIPAELKAQGTDAPAIKLGDRLRSSEAGFLTDLLLMARDVDDLVAVRLLDTMLEHAEVRDFSAAVEGFAGMASACVRRGGRIYVVCCGSSFHAAKAACLFFNDIACTELIPIIPGEFRGQYSRSLRDGDLFVAVSQSGETKDLIDVLNFIMASGRRIERVALVNNVNSTLAQEKSDLVIPLRCGPEIAVPATKSFMNQMVVFYCLALRLAEHRLDDRTLSEADRTRMREDTSARRDKLSSLPLLLRNTVASTKADVDRAAQMLHLSPSLHILATRITAVAKEGALKVREVVLNHTEGFEGSEFKHGPNTILGFNTVWGASSVDALLKSLGRTMESLVQRATVQGMPSSAAWRLVQAAADSVFFPTAEPFTLSAEEKKVFDRIVDRDQMLGSLYSDYPLVYVTGPEEKDVHLTISQINTHKIRGASTVVIAEENPPLRGAASKPPADNPSYQWVYIALPRTNDTLMTVFSATVVLQRLALQMSLLKAEYLDRLGIKEHGVHPDVPKNVSKSITVD